MYGFSTVFSGSYEEAIDRVTAELQKEGFGVLTEIDVHATLKAKLGVEKRPYKILGACNPSYANQALDLDPDLGLLLPCNVVVREEDDKSVTVAFMDPKSVLDLVNRPEVEALGMEVREKLRRVCDAIS
jgi:uncharacterized protein (DUF302 family)